MHAAALSSHGVRTTPYVYIANTPQERKKKKERKKEFIYYGLSRWARPVEVKRKKDSEGPEEGGRSCEEVNKVRIR